MKRFENLTDINNFIELLHDLVFIKNIDGVFLHCNDAYLSFIGKKREEIIGYTDFDFLEQEDAIKVTQNDSLVIQKNRSLVFEDCIHTGSDTAYFKTTKKPLYNDQDEIIGIYCVSQDMTVKKQYEIIYEDNNTLLEYLTKDEDIHTTLEQIVLFAQNRNKNKCSILLMDEEKKHLLTGAAPSLPKFYNDAIDGILIGEKVGSCGSAAFTKKRVIVENIDTHENWAPYVELTQKADFHSCWSEPILSSNNEILGTFAMYRDCHKAPNDFELKLISSYAHVAAVAIERYNNKKKLLEKEEYLTKIFNNTLSGLAHISGDRTILKCNQRIADIFGYDKPEEMIGMPVKNFHISSESLERFEKENVEKLKYEDVIDIEIELFKKDGTKFWGEFSGRALDKHKPADLKKGILWTLNDVQLKKELELSLSQKTNDLELFKQVIENVNSGIVITNAIGNNNIIYANKAFEIHTGYSRKEVIGRNCKFLQKKDKHQEGINIIREALHSEKKCQVEVRNYKKNGELFYNLLNISPVYDKNKKLKYFVGVQNDITTLKNQERLLLEQSRMVAMGEMIGNIAHQWRQPLSVISTSTSGIKLKKEYGMLDDKFLVDALDGIENSTEYLSKTIDTFRNYMRDDKKRKTLVLQNIIDKSLDIVNSSLKNHFIELRNNIKEQDDIHITLVEGELSQVIINIINNSKDAIVEKKIKHPWVQLDIKKEKDNLLISIEDNAGGIKDDILPKIFDPYFTTKHSSQGTGLGLHMSYKIITESFKGKLYARNINDGVKFFIELPNENIS